MNDLDAVLQLHRSLVRIPSVSPDGQPGTDRTGEKECAQFVAGYLREIGAAVELTEVHPGRPNVVGRFPTDRPGKPRLILAPHLDTVSVAGMSIAPFAAAMTHGRVYGRGACDDKGSVASMLVALRSIADRIPTLAHEIWFAGLAAEETTNAGAFVLAQNLEAAFVLVGEPTGLGVVHTHKGALWVRVTTRGVAGHASEPWRGDNAIYKMAPILECLRGPVIEELSRQTDPTLGPATLSVGLCHGGAQVNIIPETCVIEIDIRTIPGQTVDGLLALLRRHVHATSPDAEVEIIRHLPPLQLPADNPHLRILQDLGAKLTGANWFCDAAVFAGRGIPAAAAGPGHIAQAHTRDEWIEVDQLAQGVRFYRDFLLRC